MMLYMFHDPYNWEVFRSTWRAPQKNFREIVNSPILLMYKLVSVSKSMAQTTVHNGKWYASRKWDKTKNTFVEFALWKETPWIHNSLCGLVITQISPKHSQETTNRSPTKERYVGSFVSWKSGPLFTTRTDVLPPNLVKSRGRGIGCYNDRIALKFERNLGSSVAKEPVKLRSHGKILNLNLPASKLHDKILR